MAASNYRIREQNTVHHITSRVAHRVYFLREDERNDLIEMVRRAAEFCGIRLLAWCIMTNHFHLLVHLPIAVDVTEEEVLRRYGVLKGMDNRAAAERQIEKWRCMGKGGDRQASDWLNAQRRRMYDVGEYMKIVKQWFTEEYNRRHSHVGTLWESEYQDKPVEMTVGEMSRRMGYVHLNPIRAAAATTYEGYAWSSFAAFVRGDKVAEEGMRFVYDDEESPVSSLRLRHIALLDELLENEKRLRAEAIARKRMAGYAVPLDPLTDEAMVVQAAAHLKMVRKASEELKIAAKSVCHKERRAYGEQMVLSILRQHSEFSVEAIALATGMAVPTVYKHLRSLKLQGIIAKCARNGPWCIHIK